MELFTLVLTIVLAFIGGMIAKAHLTITINHRHEHYHDKPEEPTDYNPSYGDPEQKLYLDRHYGGAE